MVKSEQRTTKLVLNNYDYNGQANYGLIHHVRVYIQLYEYDFV